MKGFTFLLLNNILFKCTHVVIVLVLVLVRLLTLRVFESGHDSVHGAELRRLAFDRAGVCVCVMSHLSYIYCFE
jgi:hypothetical protein